MTTSDPTNTALSVSIGGRLMALPDGWVRRIADAGPLTALPFAPDWVEGLASVGGQPLLQIDPARALAGPDVAGRPGTGDKLVVVTRPGYPDAAVALRVAAVIPATGPVPLLPLERWFGALVAPPAGFDADAAEAEGTEPEVMVLVVSDGSARSAILIDQGVRVDELAACFEVGEGALPLLATVGGRLLPACRLSGQGALRRAVIGPTREGWRVVLVDRLIGLEQVRVRTLTRLPGAPAGRNLCFPLADGAPVRLMDFAALAGGAEAPGSAYRQLLARVHELEGEAEPRTAPPASARAGVAGGVIVTSGGVRWLLPFAGVERMLGPDERRIGGAGVAVLETGRWLPTAGAPALAEASGSLLLLRRSGRLQVALRVDKIALETAGSELPWLPPPVLPRGLAALVSAVRLEPATGGWCFRLACGHEAAPLAWSVRRALASAIVGRLLPFHSFQKTNAEEACG